MNLASALRALLGEAIVAADEPTRTAHSGDKWVANHDPEAVVFAQTTEQVSRLLRFASENNVPVTARGAGFGYVGGCVPLRGGIALSLARMNRIK
ncbi:MAG: FAD-binding protein, partial [Verrucomicrobiota bacterium]|nr:FAD-binding protein [Verrucomicrobiota bacterium]